MLQRLLDRLAERPGDEQTLAVLADWILEQPAPIDALWALAWPGEAEDARRNHARLAERLLGQRASELPSPVLQRRIRPGGSIAWRAAPWETADPERVRLLAEHGLRQVGIVGWQAFLSLLSLDPPLPLSRIWPLRLEHTEDLPLPHAVHGLDRLTHLALAGPAEDTPLHSLAQSLLDLPLPLRVLRLETWVPPPAPMALSRDHPTLQRLEWRGGGWSPEEVMAATLPPLPHPPASHGHWPPRAWDGALDLAASASSQRPGPHDWALATACGPLRSINEDAFRVDPRGIFAIVDGMGGQSTGAPAAAAIASALIVPGPARPRFDEAVARLQEEGAASAGTAVRLLLEPGLARLAWLGDVRAYLLREGGIEPLTEDHTMVQEAVRRGSLQPWEAYVHPHRNIVTRAVVPTGAEPEERTLALAPGDRLLVVTDGVWDALDDLVMNAIVAESASLLDAAVALVSEACRCLGTDNATALLVAPGA